MQIPYSGRVPLPAPDPTVLHPIAGQERVVFLRPLVQSANIDVGEYTYYDSYDDPSAFERDAVLYAFGPSG
jgi:virginiamycin A acetyltransferase